MTLNFHGILSSLLVVSTFLSFAWGAAVAINSTVVCSAGQCLQGFTNTTIGTVLSSPIVASSVLLLPGQYTSTTNPQLLHQLLTTSSTSSSPSTGFNVSSLSLPFNVALQPGLAIYPQALYSGQAQFAALPNTPVSSNSSSPLSAGALALSPNIWVAVTTGSSSSNRIILWDSVPDVSQLPGVTLFPSLLSNPTPARLNALEQAFVLHQDNAPAHLVSTVHPVNLSERFLWTLMPDLSCGLCHLSLSFFHTANASSACNCLNGVCGANGQCTCNAGWTTASNGTQCATCAPGFFLDGNGNCAVCQLGCQQCADGSGICVTCKQGFTQNANDRTKCDAVQSVTNSGTVCPDGSFSNGASCQPCSASCSTCSGSTSNECIVCGNGQFSLGGSCVPTDGNGVCAGSSMIANNNKHECDSCPAKCTSCGIPNFNVASTINQLQCKGCLPGFVLSNGLCVESCPSGTFLSPRDNLTCTPCSSQCSTCVGASDFCLACNGGQLASGGKCVSSCPSNAINTAATCTTCHPDCATCSGTSFNQCTSCPPNRLVLSNGRCLPTCSKTEFFDRTSGSCQPCDSSCSSCLGAGPSNCLGCSSSTSVLRGGSCAAANCNGNGAAVVPGLGVCLSDLVSVPTVSGTSVSIPLPTITGIDTPAITNTGGGGSGGRRLAWWEILLMVLGCTFIFVCILALFRRRMRAKRAQRTAAFAAAKNIDARGAGWRAKLASFFSLGGSRIPKEEKVALRVARLQHLEEERHMAALGKLGVGISGGGSGGSGLPSRYAHSRRLSTTGGDTDSFYSQVTGLPPRAPVPRQPVNEHTVERERSSRYSGTTISSAKSITEAQRGGGYWFAPAGTGTSGGSRNPFQKATKS
ncbi:insulin-like growth factor binding protein [Multifurca ochricompacta]|uniref:Insulin-like growth factor binding protein n=1 Tax=Multifurca ochricompacta TaxID=376703 RepID=A0AAD4M6G5_9AGAM|nr:insulin-like growth factor binding protein [Multifurca ochricompacta]